MSIDRLGRNYEDIQQQWRILTKERGVDICVIDMPLLDTRHGRNLMGTFIADLVLQILSFVAQNEGKASANGRQRALQQQRIRGVRFGRPARPLPDNFAETLRAWKQKKITLQQAAEACGMPAVHGFIPKAVRFEEASGKSL